MDSGLREGIKGYRSKVIIFILNLLGIIILGYFALKVFIYFLTPGQCKDPIEDYIFHSKVLYKLSLSLSENEKVKKYINEQNLRFLKNFLAQFLLPNENIKIEIYNPNLIKFMDISSYEEDRKGLFKINKDSSLQKILSSGVGGYFLKPGEYGFEFSGINPIYYNNQIIGLIEVKQIYSGPVIIPKVYRDYIKYTPIYEVGDYIVINSNYNSELLKELIEKKKILKNGKYIFLKKYKDYYFIYQIDLTKFLIAFLIIYTFFAISYLLLIWKFLFGKHAENINIGSLSKKLKSTPYIIFSKDGEILTMNMDKWKCYLDSYGEFKKILDFLKKLNLKDPMSFYKSYFHDSNHYKEVSLKLRDKIVNFKIFPISNSIKILFLEDLTNIYEQVSRLKKEKKQLEDLINELKLLLKTKNSKIAELKLQLHFLKQDKEK